MAVNTDIFLGSGASLTFVPEVDLYIKTDGSSGSSVSQITMHGDLTADVLLCPNIYVGCVIDRYNTSNVFQEALIITSNGQHTIDFSPAVTLAATDYFIIRSYGAPCFGEKTSTTTRLNADNWLGLVETGTFPNVDVEMKQLNLSLGSSRNWTHQYKGIKTASGGNVNLIANHGAWLYYALGKCEQITASLVDDLPTDDFTGNTVSSFYIDSGNAGTSLDHVINEHTDTGPFFYKSTSTKVLLPPLLKGQDARADMELLRSPIISSGTIDHYIEYSFIENNGEDLPSFALEQSLAKDPSTLTTEGTATESNTFVRVARGNRVNTLTMTANENEEVKMTLDLNTREVYNLNEHTTTEVYEARGGQATNSSLFNFASSTNAEFLEPFFFSSGSFSIFGQQYLKITALSLTINNNLMDKRFVGIGSKDIKSALPAQRSYELTFTAIVTDDKLFQELFTEGEVASGTSTIDIQFDKDDGEQILMKFQDYHLTSSNWTIPDDKGAITVDATVMPRKLNTCTVKTHWVLQG